jgi:hypothetical protein
VSAVDVVAVSAVEVPVPLVAARAGRWAHCTR